MLLDDSGIEPYVVKHAGATRAGALRPTTTSAETTKLAALSSKTGP
jgi:hypothetical protein